MWPCKGSENCTILVKLRRNLFKSISYGHEKIQASGHFCFEYMTLISEMKSVSILAQIDQTFVRGDRKQPIMPEFFFQ